MLRIRLRKPGKTAKGRHANKIVVIEKRKSRDGRFVEQVGIYDSEKKTLKFNADKYEKWVKNGAIPTDTVYQLFKKYKKQTTPAA